ncbi:MAG: hypothetical protein R2851_15495, partial [Caldilineaceae bacterium]
MESVITRIGIGKLALWPEAARIQTYPAALARLANDEAFTRQQIGSELFGLSYGPDGKARRESTFSNVFGFVQIAEDKVFLRGINLFRRETPHGSHMVSGIRKWELATDQWRPTQEAIVMGRAYRNDPGDKVWKQMLAEQLARFEPRLRVFLHLLSHGHVLKFEQPDYFSGNTQRTELIGDKTVYPFAAGGAEV